MIEPTEEARIKQLLAEGNLTTEEAQRLRTSFDNQREREAAFRQAAVSVRERRSVWLLLSFIITFFLLGAGTQWLPSSFAGNIAAPIVTAEKPTSAQAEGRLINLSRLSEERSTTMNRSLPLSISVVIIGVIALLGGLLVFLYNGLIGSREQVNAGWAQVENVYQRRLDLVPLLVDAVQTYTEHERETLSELTQARARAIELGGAIGAGTPETIEQLKAIEASQGAVQSALTRLFAVVENYPDLKASRNFLTLQDQIEGTENRVAMERRNYNEFSRRYNTRLQKFPSNIVAETMGFESKPYFEAEAKALKGLGDPFGRDSG
jgi:LemA protein